MCFTDVRECRWNTFCWFVACCCTVLNEDQLSIGVEALSLSLSPSSLLSLLSFSPGHVFPWTQQARKQCILSLY